MGLFEGKKILVTGGSGFIASHLCRRLLAEGANLYVLTRYNSIIDSIRLSDLWNQLTPVEADLRNLDALKKIQGIRPDVIYHFAAYNHVGDSFVNVSEAMDTNARGTANLLESCDGYERFIYISTSEVYGFQEQIPFSEDLRPFPISPYAVGKYAGELYARMKWHVKNLPIVVLRPFNAFGPFQSPRAVIAEMILKCLAGTEIIATEGVQTRDFNYVENLVDGFVAAALRKEAIGEIINIGSGEDVSIRSIILKIHQLTRSSSRLGIGELHYRPTEIWRMMADNRKAKELLGWSPRIGLDEGLEKSVIWYRNFSGLFSRTDSPLGKLCRNDF
jgi:nucleoside-diphosphate-sugar epimerase